MRFGFLLLCLIFFAEVRSNEPILLKSWVASANDPSSDFPIQNLPYGVFKKKSNSENPRIGVAIGNYVFDLKGAIEESVLVDLNQNTIDALNRESLNSLMSLDRVQQRVLRQKIIEILKENSFKLCDNLALRNKLLIPLTQVDLLLPIQIGDYTDFYASIHHAIHVGSIMRPDNPLMPNYKHMPIGYHGRSSSIIVSGTTIQWPSGQILSDEGKPIFDISQSLDYELEMGAIICKENPQGYPVAIEEAKSHIFGFVLLNDWSARDIQKWEYQPLGPFNGKNFATTISPWVVTLEALEPYQIEALPRSENDPFLLDYLSSMSPTTFNIEVEAYISSENMRKNEIEPLLICKGNLADLYWTFEQMISHHTSSGCNLRTGDLLGSGTISGATIDSLGCFLERIAFKSHPLELPDGTSRQFLKDGDEIVLRAYAQKEGYPKIGFGKCSGIVSKMALKAP